MLFEFTAKVQRTIDEDIEIVVEARDEVEAEEKAMEIISIPHNTDERARRYIVTSRYYRVPEEVVLEPVEYTEGPRYA